MPDVVAAVLLAGDRVALFKRSRLVTGDAGRWHCVTGYLPAGADPLDHARVELVEETGLGGDDVVLARRGDRLVRLCPRGATWQVFPFLFRTARDALELNWEHDEYRWVRPADIDELDIVPWLWDVLSAVGRPGLLLDGA
ncbi:MULTISPECIES: NUDIX domain-containing protein [Amycolatopsis]|uniref:NUDIX domain-containing protein n=1 Tax=Amycolatopsis TaxID=1813 RepID=UPI000B8AC8A0|nr:MULTISPECIES: NUDIX domain-containing protein [Amycolatopsis]OXM67165.1 hypothetical protein CF166_25035 [Amycolatopsis sp. KNN50.9b]